MKRKTLLLLGFLLSAGFSMGSASRSKAEMAIASFRTSLTMESYMIVTSHTKRIVAQFDFENIAGKPRCRRTVIMDDEQYAAEDLSADDAARLLKKFRAFDWNAEPKEKKGAYLSVNGVPAVVIALRMKKPEVFREIESIGDAIPSLVNFIEDILPPKELTH